MSEKNVKLIRKQIKNVCQELLSEEMIAVIHKKLSESVNTRLTAMSTNVDKQLAEMQQRSKDVQAYVVSRIGTPAPAPTAVKTETPAAG